MVRDRKELGKKFRQILGNNNVYFSPPDSKQMRYPCIRYNFASAVSQHADNRLYKLNLRYEVILITKSVDDLDLVEKMLELPMCSMDRQYFADGLNHYVFTIYY